MARVSKSQLRNSARPLNRPRTSPLKRPESLYFAGQLRSAREAALKDAEAFDGIVHAIERLGSYLLEKEGDLGKYREKLEPEARRSALAEALPCRYRSLLTPFSDLYEIVRSARNDALHQGAVARHLTRHAIDLALILEDALRTFDEKLASDFMVRNPICVELWQPIGRHISL